jgi:hypothetical protein
MMDESNFELGIPDNASERKNLACKQDADGNILYDENGNKICV